MNFLKLSLVLLFCLVLVAPMPLVNAQAGASTGPVDGAWEATIISRCLSSDLKPTTEKHVDSITIYDYTYAEGFLSNGVQVFPNVSGLQTTFWNVYLTHSGKAIVMKYKPEYGGDPILLVGTIKTDKNGTVDHFTMRGNGVSADGDVFEIKIKFKRET